MNEDAVSIWIRRAENDLKAGKDELATEEPATDTICFHMQQCCEKYLKAFPIFHGEEYPRTHDIAQLIERCAQFDAGFRILISWRVQDLTDYAVGVRYDRVVFPSLEETKNAVALAEKVRKIVRDKLQEKGFKI
jgi:HEPN domain-containing protein